MTTKEQERKALDKIRKIVAELGEDSYVGYAFEGCFDIAEGNIDNDFANSPLKSAEHLREVIAELRCQIDDMTSDIERLETANQIAQDTITDKASEIDYYKGLYEKSAREHLNVCDSKEELKTEINELKGQIDSRDYEIMKLKARLFDLLDK